MDEVIRFEIDYSSGEMPIERDAKVFEAGEYPDKGITITESDLDVIVKEFESVPVMVEHTATPLDPIGMVKSIWRNGRSLFGRLAFPQEIAAFIEKRGIKKLSAAFTRSPLRLAEISIVVSPRVADAALFNDDEKSVLGVNEGMKIDETGYRQMQAEINDLRFSMKQKEVEDRLTALKAAGKVVPASESYAREILLKGDGKIAFADSILTVSELFDRFLEAQPQVVTFGESAIVEANGCEASLSPEDEEMIAQLGISKEQLTRHMR